MVKPVLPSSLLGLANSSEYGAFNKTYKNVTLKIGLVSCVYDIEDEKNLSKQSPEYDVLTYEQNENKGIVPLLYRRCTAIDSLGGIGNFFEKTLTTPSNDPQLKEASHDDGTYVLLLCVDGSNTKGIILASLAHHNRKPTLTREAGTHLEGEFNGIRWKINKQGELVITQKGSTNKEGVPKTPLGSQFKFHEDGSIEFNTQPLEDSLLTNRVSPEGEGESTPSSQQKPQEYEKIKLDRTTQGIEISARKNINVRASENISITSLKNTNISVQDMLVSASGKVDINVETSMSLNVSGEFFAKGSSGKLEFEDMLTIKASQTKVNSEKIALGEGGMPAVIQTTQFMGLGNLGAPVISQAIGPYSMVVTIAP